MPGGFVDKPFPSTGTSRKHLFLRLIFRLMKLIDSALIEVKIQRSLYADYSYRVGKFTIPTTKTFFVSLQFDEHQQIRVSCG